MNVKSNEILHEYEKANKENYSILNNTYFNYGNDPKRIKGSGGGGISSSIYDNYGATYPKGSYFSTTTAQSAYRFPSPSHSYEESQKPPHYPQYPYFPYAHPFTHNYYNPSPIYLERCSFAANASMSKPLTENQKSLPQSLPPPPLPAIPSLDSNQGATKANKSDRATANKVMNYDTNVEEITSSEKKPNVKLENSELWRKFNEHVSEMIITKHGRCLFPILEFKIEGLSPDKLYSIGIEVKIVYDSMKFRFKSGKWKPSKHRLPSDSTTTGSSEGEVILEKIVMLPQGPMEGDYWMREGIHLHQLKLTNRKSTIASFSLDYSSRKSKRQKSKQKAEDKKKSNKVFFYYLESFYKYQPVLHVFYHQEGSDDKDEEKRWEYLFPETQFIAVTHYQNQWINYLKKNFNPHAKGFKKSSKSYMETYFKKKAKRPLWR